MNDATALLTLAFGALAYMALDALLSRLRPGQEDKANRQDLDGPSQE